MIADSVAVEEVLLLLKIGFLVLLYLFIWRIVRTASRDLRVPQESFIMAPGSAPAQRRPEPPPAAAPAPAGRLVVVQSPVLGQGSQRTLDSVPVTIGRTAENDIELEGDEFASSRHARFEPRADGLWVEDLGSTNGTYVNEIRLHGPRRLDAGDVVRVGETDLRWEA